ncbi:hypothetical protein UY3_17233 [Chelonia mydas]|uniref:Uncharacterized protein n=1 Tax=Chelonia mydas TaxID=8469 RepID=M7ARY5_CHEMY|nr:hypothetical protein UY3_17233 [Chelonia mydas]
MSKFAGHEFPPFIVFKIFRHTGGQGSKYISGKRTISPASEAAVDACRLMGHRKYYDQMIQDELQYQNHKIIDETDVATVKDYMQYISNLDETPAYFGGRDNCWRKLSLENFPRTMIMYDIMDYAQSGTLSNRLKEKLTFLLLRPQNEEIRHDQLMTVSRVRITHRGAKAMEPTQISTAVLTIVNTSRIIQQYVQYLQNRARKRQQRDYYTDEDMDTDVPRSTACGDWEIMVLLGQVHAVERRFWARETSTDWWDRIVFQEQKLDVTNRSHLTEHQETMTASVEDLEDHSVFSDEEWEQEAAKLYAWSQALSLEDNGESSLTPNF